MSNISKKACRLIIITSSYALLLGLTACGGKNDNSEPVVITQMDSLVKDSTHPCKQALLKVSSDLILDKNHFLTLSSAPNLIFDNPRQAATSTDEKNTQIKLNVSVSQSPIIASGLLEYKDRPAHVRFEATQVQTTVDANNPEPKSTSACLVSYKLDYHFDEPCISIREDAFKKWNQLESINSVKSQTRYFQHRRKPNKKAFLTDLSRSTQCLVSVNELQTIAN